MKNKANKTDTTQQAQQQQQQPTQKKEQEKDEINESLLTKYKIEPKLLKLRVDQLVNAPWNYKKENEKMTMKLVNNIRRNGQIETICVRELPDGKYEVVNGNHRLEAFRILGINEVYAFNLGKISDNQAKRIAVELNETKFDTNLFKLSEIVRELVDEYGMDDVLETVPLDTRDIEEMIRLNDPEKMVKEVVWDVPLDELESKPVERHYTRVVKIFEDETFRLLVKTISESLGINEQLDLDKTDFFKLVLTKIISEERFIKN